MTHSNINSISNQLIDNIIAQALADIIEIISGSDIFLHSAVGLQACPVTFISASHNLIAFSNHQIQIASITESGNSICLFDVILIDPSRNLSHRSNSIVQLRIILCNNILPNLSFVGQIQNSRANTSARGLAAGRTSTIVLALALAAGGEHADCHDASQHQRSNLLEFHNGFSSLWCIKDRDPKQVKGWSFSFRKHYNIPPRCQAPLLNFAFFALFSLA